jgi:hypothetical protein
VIHNQHRSAKLHVPFLRMLGPISEQFEAQLGPPDASRAHPDLRTKNPIPTIRVNLKMTGRTGSPRAPF